MHFKTDADQESGILFGDVDDDVECAIEYEPANKALTFSTNNNTETMRLDSNGDIKHTGGTTTTHTIFADSGSSEGSADITFNTDGASTNQSVANISMQQGSGDGAARKGSILFQVSDNGAPATAWVIYNSGNAHLKHVNVDSAQVYPQLDDVINLGHSGYRFDDIYATNDNINTSDSREKTTLTALTTNEINASKALAKEFGTYKWLSAVSEKGSNARTHIGITAQKVKEIMEANSLDPTKYAFYCYDEWDATAEETVTSEEGGKEVIKPAKAAGNRYGIRYNELHSFIVAGFNARLTALEDA
jgi:hypothetical protein